MGDLSQHFDRAEFRCHDGSEHEIDRRLLEILEAVRSRFGVPIRILSGYRSPDYNRKIGGAKDSYHCRGMAADITVARHTPREVHAWIDANYPRCGLGLYPGFVHVDSRPSRARWVEA